MMKRRLAAITACLLAVILVAGCDTFKGRRRMNEANRLYNAQKYEEAIKVYARIIENNPDHWDAHYQLAVSWLAMYHPGSTHEKDKVILKNALAALEKTMTLKPPDQEAMKKVQDHYLNLLMAANMSKEAIAFMEKRLQQSPNDPQLVNQLATLYAKEGNFDVAMRYYEKRAQLEPNEKTAWYVIGVVCWERSNKAASQLPAAERDRIIDRGLQALDRALQIDPEYFEAFAYVNLLWREKAYVLNEAGRRAEAEQAYAKAQEYTQKAMDARRRQQEKQEQEAAGAGATAS